ncbi:alpha/beta fold hydrolase [Nitratireductor sp. ZSWI3]|uniref:alpha/beta fold hydrolase n=1 Tax=Nitratireductor sp. ZSWI3 TaxID=2966359 RepID=UPI00214FFC72|nr:alpha/beta hydrolase [Nitratireductor sp. ZSWI3]MCR4265185.1 alpha/beta hydrolase [Nitratireductor sp. ZSWI3]
MTTLVTIPGIMSDARTWAPTADTIRARVEAVHVADTSQDNMLTEMARRALDATEGELIVLAHSMGGRVAMEMGRLAPERMRAMVLSSTGHEGPSEDEEPKRLARIAEGNADMAAYARNWVPKVLSKDNARNESLVEHIRQMVEDCPAEVHERQNRALLSRPDASRYLGDFDFPVLLMTGSEDHLSTPAAHGQIAALIPDAESIVIEGAGHLLPFEQPQKATQAIVEWLERRNLLA